MENFEPQKSLFKVDKNHGEPIGNLTTQIFANFYMFDVDKFVQDYFKSKGYDFYYIRFVDDFTIVCEDKSTILDSIPLLEKKLKNKDLTLHPNKRYIQPVQHGVNFVGQSLRCWRRHLTNNIYARFLERCYGFNKLLNSKENITESDLMRIERVSNSFLGFCKGLKTYQRRRKCLRAFHKNFYKYFHICGDYNKIRRLSSKKMKYYNKSVKIKIKL